MSALRQAIADFLCNEVAWLLITLVLVAGTLFLLATDHVVPTELWALDASAVTMVIKNSVPP